MYAIRKLLYRSYLKLRVRPASYVTIGLSGIGYSKLETLRKELGLKSVAKTIYFLTDEYPRLKAKLESLPTVQEATSS